MILSSADNIVLQAVKVSTYDMKHIAAAPIPNCLDFEQLFLPYRDQSCTQLKSPDSLFNEYGLNKNRTLNLTVASHTTLLLKQDYLKSIKKQEKLTFKDNS